MFGVRFQGKQLMVSRSAMLELCKEGLDLHDVLDILENGKPEKTSARND